MAKQHPSGVSRRSFVKTAASIHAYSFMGATSTKCPTGMSVNRHVNSREGRHTSIRQPGPSSKLANGRRSTDSCAQNGNRSQPTAKLWRAIARIRFTAECQRFQPPGSIKAPASVVHVVNAAPPERTARALFKGAVNSPDVRRTSRPLRHR